ncbi:ATP-grasp domain-containing protein [Streptomyces sp. HK10]|uniref:ATP-grasp domain-containing protein n=1 Tax=Streptomyces sp. HK10 TaxID=3373255 RepID=UPI00374A4733
MILYLSLRTVGWLADNLLLFGTPLLCYRMTGDVSWSGTAVALLWTPRLVSLAGAGPLLDRLSIRHVFMLCDSVRLGVGAACSLAIVARPELGLPAVLTFAVVSGVLFEPTFVAGEKAGKLLAAPERAAGVQSALTALEQAAIIAAPALGGLLLLAPPVAFVLAASAGYAAGLLLDRALPTVRTTGGRIRLLSGVRHSLGDPLLRSVVVLTMLLNYLLGLVTGSAAELVSTAFGVSASGLSFVYSAAGVVSVVVVGAAPYLIRRFGLGRYGIGTALASGVTCLALTLAPTMTLFGACLGAFLALDSLFSVYMRTSRAERVPAEVFGSTVTVFALLAVVPVPLAGATLAVLGQHASPSLVLQAAAVGALLLMSVLSPSLARASRRPALASPMAGGTEPGPVRGGAVTVEPLRKETPPVLEMPEPLTPPPAPPPRVLVIEAVSGGALLAQEALRQGHSVVIASADTADRTIPEELRDRIEELVTVETNDSAALLSAVRELHARSPVSAVFPGCDVYVPTAARVAAALGLRGLDVTMVDRVRDKTRMREAVAAAGLRCPRFTEVTDVEQLPKAGEHVGFPCVLKPVDQSGSLHVTLVHNPAELAAAYRKLSGDPFIDLGRPMGERALVEEYLAGPEYSVEGYVLDGRTTVVAVTEKILGPEPHFAELGHTVPAPLPTGLEEEIGVYVEDVVRAVGLTVGPFHCEVRITAHGPVLVEIGARMGGDRITDLVKLARGVDLARVWLAALLGEPPEAAGTLAPAAPVAGVHFFTAPGADRFTGAAGLADVLALSGVRRARIDLAPGDPIHPPTDFRCRIGWAVFTAESHEAAAELRRRIDETLRINPAGGTHA